ncbi:MAG: hypothetical protein HZB55_17145 [Deltaproteobacteria bacterium]|nr:hypothetical protein [Deltaproteobacteria bacterium]
MTGADVGLLQGFSFDPLGEAPPSYVLAEYLSMAQGYEWTYDPAPGIGGVTQIRVEGPQTVSGRTGWRIRQSSVDATGSRAVIYLTQSLDQDGWALLAYQVEGGPEVVFTPPFVFVSANPVAGESNEYPGAAARVTLVGEEALSLPSFSGSALHLRWEDLGSTPYTEDWYLGRGVGLVKSTSVSTANGHSYGAATLQAFTIDGDGDGVPDATDAFPNDPAASVDTDGDGHPDAWNPDKSQADSTSSPKLTLDSYPDNAALWVTPSIVAAGVTHYTQADGSEVDGLDLVIPGQGDPFPEFVASVTGPNGFHYEFSAADLAPWLPGSIVLSKSFPSLVPGLYTFRVADSQTHVTLRTDAHGGARRVPVVDVSTFRHARRASGAYRFSWAPVEEARTYYYRLTIRKPDGTVVFIGGRNLTNFQEVAAGTLQDGVAYEWKVDVSDAPTFDLLFNRSDSVFQAFTPSASDYDTRRIFPTWWGVENRLEADGSEYLDVDIGVPDPGVVTLAEVFGPEGFHAVFNPATDLLPGGEFFQRLPGAGVPGSYRFHVVANGLDHEAFGTLTAAVAYPAPDATTYQAETLSNGKIRFSWAGVDNPGALYYRVTVQDGVSDASFATPRANAAYVDVDAASLAPLSNRKWRVQVYDSPNFQTVRNRRNGPWVPLTIAPYDPGQPSIASFMMRYRVESNGTGSSDQWVMASDSDGNLAKLQVEGPSGYARNLLSDGRLFFGLNYEGYQLIEEGSPRPGLYTFTAFDNEGKRRVGYDYQTTLQVLPPVDHRSYRIEATQSGDLSLTWAAAHSDIPLWYYVEVLTQADHNGDGQPEEVFINAYLQQTSCTIPASALPAEPLMFRVHVRDASGWSLVSNRRQSVTVGLEDPSFDYSQLVDVDGDGYANNVDSNDADPNAHPPTLTLSVNFADYVPVTPETLCEKTFEWTLGGTGQVLEVMNGPGSVPYTSGALAGVWVSSPIGGEDLVSNDGSVVRPLGMLDPWEGVYYFSGDCALTSPPAGLSLGTLRDGMLTRWPVSYVTPDLSRCGGTTDSVLVSIQDVRLRQGTYENAVVFWSLDLKKPFRTLNFAGKEMELGIRLPTAQETRGAAVTEFEIFGEGRGLIAEGDLEASTGQLIELVELTSVTCADTDGDGVPDAQDAFPNDPAASVDTDGDGHPDAWNAGATPQQIAASHLTLDLYPNDPARWANHFGEPVATAQWADFHGALTIEGAPAVVGDEVTVYDPQGVLCGHFVVDTAGSYGVLRVYGDDPATPMIDEGAVAGDVLTFKVWDSVSRRERATVLQVVVGSDPPEWQSGGSSEVNVDGQAPLSRSFTLSLRQGWNLISFPLAVAWHVGDPPTVAVPTGTVYQPVAAIGDVFAGIAGKYSVVRSFDADGAHSFDPTLPEYLSDLTYVAGGYGYWIKMKEAADLVLEGLPLDPAATRPLTANWNLVGYWGGDCRYVGDPPTDRFGPGTVFTPVARISDILQSVVDKLIVVRSFDAGGAHSYNPTLPDYLSDLTYMGPGYGYWVKVNAAGSLQY